MNANDDAVKSFLSMGAQIAEEIRRRLDEAATNYGADKSGLTEEDIEGIVQNVIDSVSARIEVEVERSITKLGLAREDELASLRMRIERLEQK
jgi:hypothetical protein